MKTNALSLGGRISLAAAAFSGRLKESFSGITTMNSVNARVFEGDAYTSSRRSKPQILQAYGASPWLRAVVGKLYDAFTSVDWALYGVARGGKYIQEKSLSRGSWLDHGLQQKKLPPGAELMRVDAHPYYDAANSGAALMNAADLYGMTQVLLELCGECFWWKLRGANGLPVTFLLIPPLWVQETPGRDRPTFLVQFPQRLIEVPPEDMVWFKDPVPLNPYTRGEGRAGVISDELEADEFAAKHVKGWFQNRARPDLVVSVDARSAPERETLETSWRQKFEGFRRAHRVLFTNKGTEIKEIGQSFQEMELTELRKFERDVAFQVWGYPPELFGNVTNSNRATINSAEYLFARWIMVPRLEYMRKVIQTQIIEEYDARLIIGFSSPVAKDNEFVLNVAKQAPWSRTIDEWRFLQGLAALENGAGNVLLIPAKYVAVPATPEGYELLTKARADLVRAGQSLEESHATSEPN